MVDSEWLMDRLAAAPGAITQSTARKRNSMLSFEKLETWQKSIDFADLVYRVTRTFPGEERFGLTSQMRSAVVSISSNIAEGSSRFSKADFARFLEIATGSFFEMVSQSSIVRRQGFLNDAGFQNIYCAAEEQARILGGLRNFQINTR
jgi:four helix bundle protein